jgi:hypothetical protein
MPQRSGHCLKIHVSRGITDEQERELDFEIAFFEGVVQNCPDFIEALIALGDAYTRRGRYKDGLWVDMKLSRLRPADGTVHIISRAAISA